MLRIRHTNGSENHEDFTVESGQASIGRSASCTIRLTEPHLSSEHGIIFRQGTGYVYRDLDSTNGSTLLRGETQITIGSGSHKEVLIEDDDHLLLGDPSNPVILHCKVEKSAGDRPASTHRVLAERLVDDFSEVIDRLERDRNLTKLYGPLRQLATKTDLSTVLEAIVDAVFSLVADATHATVLLMEDQSKRFVPMTARSRSGEEKSQSFLMSRSILNRVLNKRSAVLAANAAEELGASESIMTANIRSSIGVPLWRDQTILGVIQCDNRSSSAVFGERELELLLVLAEQASLAIERAQLVDKLRLAEQKLSDENAYLKEKQRQNYATTIVGESPAIRSVLKQLERVADTRATVCIVGETGTGKELVANAIHHQSSRRDKMFVAQNCAALPETLLEGELFGHKKGAFTGADRDKKGLFELADGGTLFLDEIGEMSLPLQAKLLRVLQEGEIRPLGATTSKRIDVRIVCATNRDLLTEVKENRFREDLYYRINVFPIRIPPLRERRDDISKLAEHFLKQFQEEMRKPVSGISQEAINALKAHAWPGNIRELQNEVQRLVIQVDDGGIIGPEHISSLLRTTKVESGIRRGDGTSLKEQVEDFERDVLLSTLAEHDQNKTQTAAALGMTREGLHKKLAKLGLK